MTSASSLLSLINILSHQQIVENPAPDYNGVVPHLRIIMHCIGIYYSIIFSILVTDNEL